MMQTRTARWALVIAAAVTADDAVAAEDPCPHAVVCDKEGLCTMGHFGLCVATSQRDCYASMRCEDSSRCFLDADEQRCVKFAEAPALATTPATQVQSTQRAGEVVAAVGAIASIAGLSAIAAGLPSFVYTGTSGADADEPLLAAGGAMLGGGAILAGIGLSLALGGPDDPNSSANAALPSMTAGPGSASFAWTF